jgi:hypothetical protein
MAGIGFVVSGILKIQYAGKHLRAQNFDELRSQSGLYESCRAQNSKTKVSLGIFTYFDLFLCYGPRVFRYKIKSPK